MIDADANCVLVEYPDGSVERIKRNCTTKAPGRASLDDTIPTEKCDNKDVELDERPSQRAIRTQTRSAERKRYVVDKILSYDSVADTFKIYGIDTPARMARSHRDSFPST